MGPQFLSTMMQCSSMSRFSSSMRLCRSSALSNTTARPLCTSSSGVAALGLMMAPLGARLPRSTQMPALSLKGSAWVRMTCGL
ncbi:hypothetical protein D9M69_533760 [compost metagenome]